MIWSYYVIDLFWLKVTTYINIFLERNIIDKDLNEIELYF